MAELTPTETITRPWTDNERLILVKVGIDIGGVDESKLDSSKAELSIDRLRRAIMSG